MRVLATLPVPRGQGFITTRSGVFSTTTYPVTNNTPSLAMSNYTWYVFVDDLSLWLQTNLKDGHQPDWNEFLNVVRPAKSLLSDRAHYAFEKFGELALNVQDNWNFVNDESRMTPRAASITRAWLMAFCVSLYAPMILSRRKGALKGGVAAFVQSTLYGEFTPAGSLFATMTTIGTLGRESPLAITGATVVASAIAGGMYLATAATNSAQI
ncbi:hypothetical protein RSOL_030160 [Rhizoctonia solani AG-3 Rhs1AP]|uniref:Uncharacterized protein n=1 Tax=Rhizoctonia solani AG-3 Rhs1AP TaxID=1086054 RepID=X8IYN6_9AGAM|nr:hypothetical protein RSOL_030160 [Rhizoctonia solani AG-3 Rhs1AP]